MSVVGPQKRSGCRALTIRWEWRSVQNVVLREKGDFVSMRIRQFGKSRNFARHWGANGREAIRVTSQSGKNRPIPWRALRKKVPTPAGLCVRMRASATIRNRRERNVLFISSCPETLRIGTQKIYFTVHMMPSRYNAHAPTTSANRIDQPLLRSDSTS